MVQRLKSILAALQTWLSQAQFATATTLDKTSFGIQCYMSSIVGALEMIRENNTVIDIDPEQPPDLNRFYNDGNIFLSSITSALDNFTTGVSNYLRTVDFYNDPEASFLNKPERNQPVEGEAFTVMTSICIRWVWLTLPASLFVGVLLFLLTLIAQMMGKDRVEVWESSQVVLNWHGLDGPAIYEGAKLTTASEMDRRAAELIVRLEMTGKGWKLIQH